ncbi:MAG: hypothetical protein RL141_155 [Candidatus Parcubacteria bacterium]|jgi:hypothetical protein
METLILAFENILLVLGGNKRHFVWSVWRRFRLKMLCETVGVILVVIALDAALSQIPGLKNGWMSILSGKNGNIILSPIREGSHSTSVLVRLLVPLFFVVFTFIIPFLARFEEDLFRRGYRRWGSIAKQSIWFGLIHSTSGVPPAACIALIIAGLFYGIKYKRAFEKNLGLMDLQGAEDEAIMVSTTYHTMYNTVLGILLFSIALSAV